ncbi:MAG: thermonuclease family protein [Candidatus Omnitrophica bacterium]|nr:thermonuclease family protein [Candidatus Omnitrophota bacterium]
MAKKIFYQTAMFCLLYSLAALPSFSQPAFQEVFGVSKSFYSSIKVQRVIATDLIQLENGEKVRLIGLKSPFKPLMKRIVRDENGRVIEEDSSPETPLQETALEFMKELLLKKIVRLEFDDQKKDDDFNTMAYVFILEGGIFANAEILKQGFANLSIQQPNIKYADTLRAAYREAKEQKRGLQGE